MSGRIVIFGATGYTGELVARSLCARGVSPVLAGRSRERLDALAAELGGPEVAVADVADPASVAALVQRGDVLVACVGPFSRWGRPAVDAAIATGAHYLDSTGEPPFIRAVFEDYGPGAAAAGCGLLTAFGYDWVPGNLAGALALRDAGPDAVRVEVGYYMRGAGTSPSAMSGGTRASIGDVMLADGFAWRGGHLVTERTAVRRRAFEPTPGRPADAVSTGGSEHFALPRLQDGLRDVDVYLGWFGPLSAPLQLLSAATALARRVPGAQRGLRTGLATVLRGSTGGPSESDRAGVSSLVFGEAFAPDGTRLAHVRLEGANAYTFTGDVLAWGARTAAAGGLHGTGALGPADGFGLDELQAGVAEAGIERVA